jgi:hypothetical protein
VQNFVQAIGNATTWLIEDLELKRLEQTSAGETTPEHSLYLEAVSPERTEYCERNIGFLWYCRMKAPGSGSPPGAHIMGERLKAITEKPKVCFNLKPLARGLRLKLRFVSLGSDHCLSLVKDGFTIRCEAFVLT